MRRDVSGRPLDRFVQQGRHVLLPIPLSGGQNHDAVLDGQRVQVVDHHMVRLGQQGRLTGKRGVLKFGLF